MLFRKPNSRLIYLQRTNYKKPLQGYEEFLGEQDTESVREQDRGFESFHGFNITGDQPLEDRRLGVREDIYNAIGRIQPGRNAGLRIIDERINRELRGRMTRERGLDKQRRGWFGSRWVAGAGFLENCRNLVRTNSGIISRNIENEYGRNETFEGSSLFVAQQFLTTLTPAQTGQVENFLLTRGVMAPPIVPAGMNAVAVMLSSAEPEILHEMRTQLFFIPPRRLDPIYPTNMPVPAGTLYDRLIEFRERLGSQKEKAYSTTVYDATRLDHFLVDLRRTQQAIFERLTNKILIPHALYPLERNPEAQTLVAYLEQRIHERGTADLDTELQNIEDNLPTVEEKREEGKEPSDELLQFERLQELTKSIQEIHSNLGDKYNEAESTGSQLWNLNRKEADLRTTAQAMGGGGPGHQQVDIGLNAITQQTSALEKDKAKLQTEINNSERKFLQQSNELLAILNGRFAIPAPAHPDPYVNLRTFDGNFGAAAALHVSNEVQLFGENYPDNPARNPRGQSQLEQRINTFTPSQMKDMGKEIKKEYHRRFKKKERIDCRQLMTLLKEGDYARQGVTNPELRRRRALEWTNIRIAKVGSLQMFRQTNQELAEYLGETTLGSRRLSRFLKRMRAQLTHGSLFGRLSKSGVLQASDVIDHVAGFDKDFHMFLGLPKDATLSEIRDRIETHGGITSPKLFEFSEKLKQAYLSFEMLNSAGKVELLDGDGMDMERLIENLLMIREELDCRQLFDGLRPGIDNKAEAMLKMIREHYEARRKDEIDILSRISPKNADWKQIFSRKYLKQKFLDSLKQLRKQKKDEKLSYGEFAEKLKEGGLTSAYDMLKYGLIADEGIEVGKKFAKWTGGKGKKAGEKLSRAKNWVWQKGLKPVGHYTLAVPAQTAGKIIAAPFKLAHSMGKGAWNWIKS
jgi:hypothetical protein